MGRCERFEPDKKFDGGSFISSLNWCLFAHQKPEREKSVGNSYGGNVKTTGIDPALKSVSCRTCTPSSPKVHFPTGSNCPVTFDIE